MGVERPELVCGFEEQLALALAVDVHQQRSELAQRGERGRLIVDIRGAAAGARHAAHQDELVVVERSLQDVLDGLAQTGLGQLETADDAQLLGAGAEQVAGAALADQQAEGREQQRLAGAGLAGPGAEAGLQLDAHVLD